MENRPQEHYSVSSSNPTDSRPSNMYLIQVQPNNSEGSLEADAIPLHMLINEQDPQNEHIFIPVVQGKELQLYIDSREQPGSSMNPIISHYYSVKPEQQINTELQVPNSEHDVVDIQRNLVEIKLESQLGTNASSASIPIKINDVKSLSSGEQKKKTVQKFLHISDRPAPARALAVLPGALALRRAAVEPRRALPALVRFGPVEGVRCELTPEEADTLKLEYTNSGLPVFLLKTEDGTVTHIDVSDKDKSNWICLLPLGDQSTANVWLYQEDHQLYAATTRSIPARTPLLLGYSKEYVDDHNLQVEEPVLDLDAELAAKHRQWWCHECQRSMPTASLLQRHIDMYHKEKKRKSRRYRCPTCSRYFCRLFTLRRHVARHCITSKRLREEKIDEAQTANALLESSKPDDLPDLSINTTAVEDSRLPSDESLQTLTHNLDFSTNLFDTDRMPNLDISGSSRSETDFNYSLGLKDDIGLGSSIDFGLDVPCSKKEPKTENTEPVFVTCRYCNEAVVRGRQRQHVKLCTGRKFHCECGRAFQYKDKLALHIHIEHANLTSAQRKEKGVKEDEMPYKCETCNHKFKRRGMLVNHLWRVHQTSTAVPLEKKVRHYPCGLCPKLYRTAAKRNMHAKIHHPGSEVVCAGSIEGGRVSCVAAACAACPRQYATRAKLLQHVRQHHPALAPPLKK